MEDDRVIGIGENALHCSTTIDGERDERVYVDRSNFEKALRNFFKIILDGRAFEITIKIEVSNVGTIGTSKLYV